MCISARSPVPMHVAAARFTPASLIAAATSASAPGEFSMSMTRSKAIRRSLPPSACRAQAPLRIDRAQARGVRDALDRDRLGRGAPVGAPLLLGAVHARKGVVELHPQPRGDLGRLPRQL